MAAKPLNGAGAIRMFLLMLVYLLTSNSSHAATTSDNQSAEPQSLNDEMVRNTLNKMYFQPNIAPEASFNLLNYMLVDRCLAFASVKNGFVSMGEKVTDYQVEIYEIDQFYGVKIFVPGALDSDRVCLASKTMEILHYE